MAPKGADSGRCQQRLDLELSAKEAVARDERVFRLGASHLSALSPTRTNTRASLRAGFLLHSQAGPSCEPHRLLTALSGTQMHTQLLSLYSSQTPPLLTPWKEVAFCLSQDLSLKNVGEAQDWGRLGPAQHDSAVFWGLGQVTGRKP